MNELIILGDWDQNWKSYLSSYLNARIIHFLDEYFKKDPPSLEEIISIPDSDLFESWLSVVSMKELMLFQQNLKIQLSLKSKS